MVVEGGSPPGGWGQGQHCVRRLAPVHTLIHAHSQAHTCTQKYAHVNTKTDTPSKTFAQTHICTRKHSLKCDNCPLTQAHMYIHTYIIQICIRHKHVKHRHPNVHTLSYTNTYVHTHPLTQAYTSLCSQSIPSEPLSRRGCVTNRPEYTQDAALLSRSVNAKTDNTGHKEHSNMKQNQVQVLTTTGM